MQFKLVSKRVRDVSDATATKAYVQNEREKRKKNAALHMQQRNHLDDR